MNPIENSGASGAPGIEPRWTSSAKEGVGTAYHTSCRLWFTLSHGIINEIYYPRVDQPNTRDFQFLITDGETFCHEEKRDLNHLVEYPERDCLFYRLTNSERRGRYRLIKHVLADPHRSVLLIHTQVDVIDESLRGKLRLYALLAPHGAGNSGRCCEIGASTLMHAQREDVHLVTGCSHGFTRRSVGYVGASDGWQDLTGNFKMDWEFRKAEKGNIALTGEIDLPDIGEFTIAVACGGSYPSTAAKLLQSLAEPFESHRERYVRQWQRAVVNPQFDFSKDTCDGGGMYRLSRCFDRVEPAFQRYVVNPVQSRHEIWSLRHPLPRMSHGKILRIILAAEATIVWSTDDWARTNRLDTAHLSELNLWFADFPSAEWLAGSVFTFTCFWKHDQRWEGRNWQVSVL